MVIWLIIEITFPALFCGKRRPVVFLPPWPTLQSLGWFHNNFLYILPSLNPHWDAYSTYVGVLSPVILYNDYIIKYFAVFVRYNTPFGDKTFAHYMPIIAGNKIWMEKKYHETHATNPLTQITNPDIWYLLTEKKSAVDCKPLWEEDGRQQRQVVGLLQDLLPP